MELTTNITKRLGNIAPEHMYPNPATHHTAGPEAPPLVWDTEQQYTRDRLDVYYLSHSGKPISEEQLTEVGPTIARPQLPQMTDDGIAALAGRTMHLTV
jgi:hypothetical protein